MNNIGIDHNLDRARIRKLLTIGLFASVLTGIGDFLLGYAESTAGSSLAAAALQPGCVSGAGALVLGLVQAPGCRCVLAGLLSRAS